MRRIAPVLIALPLLAAASAPVQPQSSSLDQELKQARAEQAAAEARAAKLATVLADAGIKGIYTSEFKRTQDTAKPLASKLGLTIEVVPSKDAAGLAAKIKAAHPRDSVLIIGHSNTIPELIRAFGGPEIKIADDEYSGIYILTPSTGALTLIRY